MLMPPTVWTIAGSDSSGGAGIQADLKTFQQLGTHGCSIITAVTAQSPTHVATIQYLSAETIAAQLKVMENELPPLAIKIGMLGDDAIVATLIEFLRNYQGDVVFDPVMKASCGEQLFQQDKNHYLKKLQTIFPYINLFTPNLKEAELFFGRAIRTYEDMQEVAHLFIKRGIKNVLIKGGHFQNDKFCQDYWTNGSESFWLSSKRYPEKNYRGTGCVFSSAISAALALGYAMKDALVIAKMYVNQGIRLAHVINQQVSHLHHSCWPENEIDLPLLSSQPILNEAKKFAACGERLGLYPIIDSSDWINQLAKTGINVLQLRIKNKEGDELAKEIKKSIQLAKEKNIRLFINDHWELAILYGAYGVHLGQTDMTNENIAKIYQAGLRLGISTHCYYEVARAHAICPSYLAVGPIFHTDSKAMPFLPQGISSLKRWRRTLHNYPLVAIGGINEKNIADIARTGVDGIAMISAITRAKNPAEKIAELITHLR